MRVTPLQRTLGARINPFYASHQLFRLAALFPSRYPSEFQISVETSHFNSPDCVK